MSLVWVPGKTDRIEGSMLPRLREAGMGGWVPRRWSLYLTQREREHLGWKHGIPKGTGCMGVRGFCKAR